MTTVSYGKTLTKGAKPKKSLLVTLKSHAGRNSAGRITVRHQGGGNKRRYRLVDFKQTRFLGVPAVVESLQYDPYRTAFIALVKYRSGEYAYLLAPQGLKAGDEIVADETAPLTPGNRMRLGNVPTGFRVYNVEMQPGRGGQLARSAGGSTEVMAHEGGYTNLRLPSGEVRKILSACYASLGELSNAEHSLVVIGKAGRSRWLGRRPTVRGNAMNPVDHPHGGGEGKQPRGTRKPKNLWGKVTGGRKTRSKTNPSTKFIVKRRPGRLTK